MFMAACEAGHLLELTSDSCTEDFGASIALLRQVEQHSLRRRGGKNLIIRDRNPFTSARTPRSSAGFTLSYAVPDFVVRHGCLLSGPRRTGTRRPEHDLTGRHLDHDARLDQITPRRLLNHLSRPQPQRRWDREPERLGGLEVDDQFERRR